MNKTQMDTFQSPVPAALMGLFARATPDDVGLVLTATQIPGHALVVLETGYGKPSVLGSSLEIGHPTIDQVIRLSAVDATKANKPLDAAPGWQSCGEGVHCCALGDSNRVLYVIKGKTLQDVVQSQANTIRQLTQKVSTLAQKFGGLRQAFIKQVEKRRATQKRVFVDQLTKVRNRAAYDAEATTLFHEVERDSFQNPAAGISVVTFDIDHFKNFNDAYGHKVGDLVLQHVVRVVGSQLRDSDVLYRTGGEEFVILYKTTNKNGPRILAEKIRKALAEPQATDVFCHPTLGTALPMTISVGAVLYLPGQGLAPTPDDVLQAADHLMYLAKQTGRNKTVSKLFSADLLQAALARTDEAGTRPAGNACGVPVACMCD